MHISPVCITQNSVIVNVQKISEKEELSSPNARKVIYDQFGFIWIATEDGLNRFDGRQFLVFNKNSIVSRQKTAGSDFKDITEDTENNCIWALTSNNGINKISNKTASVISEFKLPESDEEFYVNGILTVSDLLMVYTNKNYYFAKRKSGDDGFKKIKITNNSFRNEEIQNAILINGDSVLLCSGSGSIFLFNVKSYVSRKVAEIKILKDSKFKFTGVSKTERNLYLATTEGLYEMSEGFELKKIVDGSISAVAANERAYFFSKDNTLYSSVTNSGTLCELKIAGDPNDSTSFQNIYALCAYRNSLFMGGGSKFLIINNLNTPFTKFFKGNGKSIQDLEHVSYINAINDSVLRFCSVNGIGDLNINNGFIKWYSTDQDYYRFVSLNKNEAIFSGIKSSYIYSFKEKQKKKLPTNFSFLKNDFIICSYTSSRNFVYLATYYGRKLYKVSYPYSSHSSIETLNSTLLTKDILAVNNIVEDKDDILFVCDKDIVKYNEITKSFRIFSIRKSPKTEKLEILMDLCKIKKNFFIAAYGYGLIKTDEKFNFISCPTENKIIASLGFYKIFPLGDTGVILSSNNGLLLYNLKAGLFKHFDEDDGLHNKNFDEFSGSRIGNLIFAGGIRGVTKINTDKLSASAISPKIYLKNYTLKYDTTVKDSTNLDLRKIVIDNKVNIAELNFGIIDFESTGKVYFEYQIAEISSSWVNNGTNNVIQLIGFKPGKYHLFIRAHTTKDIYSDVILFQLLFLPKWYQTWWFKLLVALVTGGIIYAFYRYRIRQIKKQHEIRKNIATDLHDDLGSTLNSVKVFTNLAISGVKQEESLQQVKDNLTEATMSLRDMIWVLDDSLDTVDELVTRLKQFALPVTAASNMEFKINAGSDVNARTLSKEEKRNLFLICKEAINNSIKYSGASKITVDIEPAGKKIRITLADNGKGFNETTVKKGYGLKNMQYRAGQVRYRAEVESSNISGTSIKIVPA